MKKGLHHLFSVALLFVMVIPLTKAQEPDLSKFHDSKEKITALASYCESLRINPGGKSNFPALQQAALKGISITPETDAADRARFFFYCAIANYYQVKFDSAQYYFYQSLREAQKAKSAEFITSACVALIPVNFQLRQQNKVDSCKDILQSILDTTHNKKILQDGYSAMGSYYQQKAYYNTAQDYLIKSIELRKPIADTTSDVKLKLDYAIQCYLLSKQYENTDVLDKSLDILREGEPFSNYSPVVSLRYLSSFTEIYVLLGNIDSALIYANRIEQITRNSQVVSSEQVSANLNIAKYYLGHMETQKALPYITQADTLANRSKSPLLLYQAAIWKGRYLEEMGKFTQAIVSLNQSLPPAKQFSKEQYTEALKYMALAQKGAGNANEAISYYEQYADQSDSLTKEKISQNLADQETRYETNKKEQHIVSLSKENKLELLELQTANRTRLFLILGLIALSIIALLLYFIYRNKENTNHILNERNYQLDLLNQKLVVANNTKARLFGIIGHDLRSPVSQIVQFLQIQKENNRSLPEEARLNYEKKLHTASENVLETMEDLLLWSKSQMQQFIPQFNLVAIGDIVQKELTHSAQLVAEKDLKINMRLQPGYSIQTDENFATVVIRNLLQNAIKYSEQGSALDIWAEEESLRIGNKCSSTTANHLNEILNSKVVNSKSSGLGLQIASDLATSIHSKIQFLQDDQDRIISVLSWKI
jgi:signal transduction histidine kinase